MRKIIVEDEISGMDYPIVTLDEIRITHKQLKKLSLGKLKFNDDLSALIPYEMTEEEVLIRDNVQIRKDISVIEKWFALYDKQVVEYNRCKRLGIVYDCKYGTIDSLDNQAVERTQKINELHCRLTENLNKLRYIFEKRQLRYAENMQSLEKDCQSRSLYGDSNG